MENVPVRINRVHSTGRSTGEPLAQPVGKPDKNNKKKIVFSIIFSVVLLAGIVAAGWFMQRTSIGVAIDTTKYQAVFFTNGQVYFGKLDNLNDSYFKLNKVFYLQTKTDATDSKNPQETTTESTPDVQLIKLGDEIHGPDDEMIISKDQILFFENLKKDGKVSISIDQYFGQKN